MELLCKPGNDFTKDNFRVSIVKPALEGGTIKWYLIASVLLIIACIIICLPLILFCNRYNDHLLCNNILYFR